MKKNPHFSFIVCMSFAVVHTFAIDILDTHKCQVSEYVEEFSQAVHLNKHLLKMLPIEF